ncbi:hypothetical protein niasHS_007075 [Heterodera schachtii]|uniref:Serine/threonine-protein kinase haspin C-terminal domain-containing protein n=1 Tax=Heterodera schachtii TaxID=97005 RepID=A0ABD2JFE9_HETSC
MFCRYQYEFRVKAVNKAVPGEASDPSQKLLAKARQGPLGVKDVLKQNGVSNGGDYQYDLYNMMKAAVSDDNWASFCPRTNILWMGYAAKKLFNNRFIRAKRKEAIEELFSNFEQKFCNDSRFACPS